MLAPSNTSVQPTDLKKRSDVHLARKVWHLSTVLIMAYVHSRVSYHTALLILAISALIILPIDIIRLKKPALNKLMLIAFKPIMRESESYRFCGISYLILGVTVVALIFPFQVVSLTLLFLAVADPVASYFGVKYGKDKIIGEKSLQGFIGAFIACTAIALLFFFSNNLVADRLILASLLAGLIGALAEIIPLGKLDDNLTLPIFSAVGLWLLLSLFGGL